MWFKTTARERLYADAAAGTPLSPRAKRVLVEALELYGNAGALHQEALAAKAEMDRARKRIADAIGAHADEIVFTASGTESNNLAVTAAKGRHAVTTAIEHQSVLEPLRHVADTTEVPVDAAGFVDLAVLKEALTPETGFVSIQMVNSEVGTIQPIREIAKLLRKQGKKIVFHTDAAQAPLWLPLKVEALGVDLMTLDAQKVLGPKGVGCLYIKRGTALEPVMRGGVQEGNLRAGTPNTPLCASFGVAMEDAAQDAEARAAKTAAVRDLLRDEIKRHLPDVLFHGPPSGDGRVANNLNVSVPGLDGEMAVIALDALGIAVSTRSACTIGDEEPSHVIKALGVAKPLAKTAVRITLLPDATAADARRIAAALAEVAMRYKQPAVISNLGQKVV